MTIKQQQQKQAHNRRTCCAWMLPCKICSSIQRLCDIFMIFLAHTSPDGRVVNSYTENQTLETGCGGEDGSHRTSYISELSYISHFTLNVMPIRQYGRLHTDYYPERPQYNTGYIESSQCNHNMQPVGLRAAQYHHNFLLVFYQELPHTANIFHR